MTDLKASKSGLLIRGSLVRAQLEEPHNASKFGALANSLSLPNLLSEYFRIHFPNKISLFSFWRTSCNALRTTMSILFSKPRYATDSKQDRPLKVRELSAQNELSESITYRRYAERCCALFACLVLAGCGSSDCGKYPHAPSPSSVNPSQAQCDHIEGPSQ